MHKRVWSSSARLLRAATPALVVGLGMAACSSGEVTVSESRSESGSVSNGGRVAPQQVALTADQRMDLLTAPDGSAEATTGGLDSSAYVASVTATSGGGGRTRDGSGGSADVGAGGTADAGAGGMGRGGASAGGAPGTGGCGGDMSSRAMR